MQKLVFFLMAMMLVLSMTMSVSAEETIISVSNATELDDAMTTINTAISGEFIISLTSDVITSKGMDFTSNVTTTILGNGHTITVRGDSETHTNQDYLDSFIVIWNGTVNLGNADGNVLTITQGSEIAGGDSSSCIQVIANKDYGDGSKSPALNMYDGVTISNWRVDNSYGAAVRLYSHQFSTDLKSTFNMYGGLIKNCGFTGGATQQGGGVAVMHNGEFNMSGGTITGCVAYLENHADIYDAATGGGVCLTFTAQDAFEILYLYSKEANNPVFNMTGGIISDNAANEGGGVSVLNGTFNLDSGTVANNFADSFGGGIVAFGDYYGNLDFNGQLNITGGKIIHNYNTSYGGGIAALFTAPVTMTGGILCNNRSTQRGDDLAAIFRGENITLSRSAATMGQEYESFRREESVNTWTETRFGIDGWYVDGDSNTEKSELYRWKYAGALNGGTIYRIGDTVQSNGKELYVKAAFTPYDEIDITKMWEDYDNQYETRPDTITFTLKDSDGNIVKLRSLDGSATEDAAVTISKDDIKAVIAPLSVADYSAYTIEESTMDGYISKQANITFDADSYTDSGSTVLAQSGVYSTTFTNTWKRPVKIVKIWNDANNKDGIRPAVLNTQLVIGSTPQADMDGRNVFPLEEDRITHTWTTTVYLPAKDYSALQATEGAATGYEQSNYHRSITADGTLSFVFENKHTPAPAEMNTVANGSMVNINYEARKTWLDTPPTVAKPNVKIKLTGDNGYSDVQSLVNDTATFANIPKYLDNEGNNPVTYTLSEVLDDPLWIEVNGEFYSLDGMGKYIPRVTNVTAAEIGSTGAGGTVTTGTIENSYVYNQPTTSATVTKRWNDHQNENGARPQYLKLGLFKAGTDSIPASTVIITGQMNDEAWNGTFMDLPLYDDSGAQIDYSSYIIKEAYPATLNPDGTPAGWDNWVGYGESYTMTKDGHTYKYDYSVVTEP